MCQQPAMRLLNAETFKLEEFFYVDPPRYAILSHTWGADNEEVSYRDVLDGRLDERSSRPPKVAGCCGQARRDGYQYVWIDTCCIDKTNSVELQEAINSMFRWYQDAAICYVFLSDVPATEGDERPLHSSRWFQRGWTLQELLAPLDIRFYDADWGCIGTKGDLCDTIEEITGIPTQFLLGIADLHHASVAQRMSWAAKRVTKRREDMAYCLLGIFGVSMPMIYGEGDKAFRRLQEQIIKDIGDPSILAWELCPEESVPASDSPVIFGTALAPAPIHFQNCGKIITVGHTASRSLHIQGGSLHLSLPLHTMPDGQLFGLVDCGLGHEPDKIIGIPLAPAPEGQPDKYVRIENHQVAMILKSKTMSPTTTIQIQLDGGRSSPVTVTQTCWFHIRNSIPGLKLAEVGRGARWHRERALVEVTLGTKSKDSLRILTRFCDDQKDSKDFIAALKIESGGRPSCHLMVASEHTALDDIADHPGVWVDKVSGQQSASNGYSALRVMLESIQSSSSQQRFMLKLQRLSGPPLFTINVTELLWTAGIRWVLVALRDARQASLVETHKLKSQAARIEESARRINQDLKMLRDQIQYLQMEEERLAEKRDHDAEELFQIQRTYKNTEDEAMVAEYMLSAILPLLGPLEHQLLVLPKLGEDQAALAEQKMLPVAVDKGYHAVVTELLRRGVRVNEKDPNGRTALHHAASRGEDQLAIALILKGARVNTADNSGATPIYYAVVSGSKEITQLLLEHRADPHGEVLPEGEKSSLLHLAVRSKSKEIVKLLLDGEAKLDARDGEGLTPLELATKLGLEPIANLLLERELHQAELRQAAAAAAAAEAVAATLAKLNGLSIADNQVRAKKHRSKDPQPREAHSGPSQPTPKRDESLFFERVKAVAGRRKSDWI